MATLTTSTAREQHTTPHPGPRAALLCAASGLLILAGLLVAHDPARRGLFLVGAVLLLVAVWVGIAQLRSSLRARAGFSEVAALTENDPQPLFLAGPEGHIRFGNRAARSISCTDICTEPGATVATALRDHLACPATVLGRLETRAASLGAALEDIETRAGRLRIAVHTVRPDLYLWRIERAEAPPVDPPDAQPLTPVADARGTISGSPDVRVGAGTAVPAPVPVHDPVEGDRGDGAVDGWTFFDHLPVPLLKLDTTGTILLSNRPARALLGCDEAQGLRLGDRLEGLGRPVADWIADAGAERGTLHPEFLRVRRADRETFVQVALNRARDGEETVLIAVINDATELKSLEAQFAQSQKMQAIGQLAGGIAHDFNNLLTAITGHCDLLMLRHDAEDQDYADLTQINQNANRAAALVSQLLAYSRKQTMHPQIIDLRDTLADLTHMLNRLVGERISLTLRHEPGLDAIRVDKRQLEQVIMNLVVNARDAMPRGGEIRIVTRNLQMTEPLRRDRATVAPGAYVSVEVSDDGTGIAPDKLSRIFEPFFTTKGVGQGTGLGLSTAYGIVKQSGGFIFADSVVGEGTTFRLLFPAHPHHEVARGNAHDAPVCAGNGSGVVLLVEDEVPVRTFASRALQLRGYSVVEAGSAEEALDLLGDAELKVDVFVTDVVMPGRDGPSWVQTALADRPEVPVVFISGYAEETFGDIRSRIPASAFLAKPFSLKELVATVQRLSQDQPSERPLGSGNV